MPLHKLAFVCSSGLTDAADFSKVTTASTLVVGGPSAVTSLDGLGGIDTLSTLYVTNNDLLTSLAGLAGLTTVTSQVLIYDTVGLRCVLAFLCHMLCVQVFDFSITPARICMLYIMIQVFRLNCCCALHDSQQSMLPATNAEMTIIFGVLQQRGCAGYHLQLYRDARCNPVRQRAGRLRDLLILC